MTSHDYSKRAMHAHKMLDGKIKVTSKTKLQSHEDLSIYYTPGVGAVSMFLNSNPKEVSNYTIASNTVAVISDGSAVLGLGNVGPEAALPVMEGKAMLFAELAGLNAFPICLRTQDADEIVKTIINISTVFAAINLEDIAAPQCFEIEKQLQSKLSIPVVHDDQHATAIAVLAGLINSLKVVKKDHKNTKAVVLGAGAAGNAVAKILVEYGLGEVIVVDSKGILSSDREDLDENKLELLKNTNHNDISGELEIAAKGADIIIGVTTGGKISKEIIHSMNTKPIVFALANPIPEILPEEAKAAGAAIVATGRSDYANQINNVLVFPGLFKGLIESKQKHFNAIIKLKAAKALADCVLKPSEKQIIPDVFDKNVVLSISKAISIK
jgi:malate dehydrogenase (oxaloacetate-decarboxylating)